MNNQTEAEDKKNTENKNSEGQEEEQIETDEEENDDLHEAEITDEVNSLEENEEQQDSMQNTINQIDQSDLESESEDDFEEDISEEEGSEEDDLLTEEEQESDDIDEHAHKKNIVEGALFIAGRPVNIEELHVKTDLGKTEIEELLNELAMDYLMRPTALEIVQIQDKYSLQIKPEYTPKLKKFASGGLIPDAILKTLTIIALKQPIMKSKLVKIRGSTTYEHVKYLEENGYVDSIKKGRSSELSTTDQFSDTFGLSRDITELKQQMITQLGIKENATNNTEQ